MQHVERSKMGPGPELHQPDWAIIIGLGFLIIIGLITLASASYAEGCQKLDDCYFYLRHQLLFGMLPGLVLGLAFSLINYQHLKKIAFPLLIVSFLLLIAVFSPQIGFARSEAQRWIKIAGFTFQPSELVKLSLLIYLSAILAKNQARMKKMFVPFVIILISLSFLIIAQPNISTLIVIIATALVVYFIAGCPLTHLIWLGGGLGVGLAILVRAAPYRMARLTSFLHPEIDLQGASFHINQALIGIGSGGIFGKGLGHSMQKLSSLPEVISDSIFAVLAEEFGFILTALIVGLYVWLTWRIFHLARNAPCGFGKFLSAGIGFLFIFQAVVNMAAMTGLVPLTGIPLPFISYGGSNLCIFLALFGILVNISKQTHS